MSFRCTLVTLLCGSVDGPMLGQVTSSNLLTELICGNYTMKRSINGPLMGIDGKSSKKMGFHISVLNRKKDNNVLP